MHSGDNMWYIEPVQKTFLHQLKLKAVIYSGRTAHQTVDVIETEPLGRTLVLDGKTQSAEEDEFIYHEALVHPAMLAHPSPRTVLVAGGAEGAVLREVLAHRTVERVVMVDLDPEVVQVCRTYLPQWSRGAFDDPRTEMVFGDARAYLERQAPRFDLIIMDITDPTEGGPGLSLFSEEFYRMAMGRLAPGGALVTHAGPADFGMAEVFTAICRTLEAVAGSVSPYRTGILSYGGEWGFAYASKDGPLRALTPDEVDRRIAQRVTAELRFYDGAAHAGMFGLPKWLRRELAAQRRVISEHSPVFID